VDPKYNAYESRYSVNGDNPIWYNDPFGDYKSKEDAEKAKAAGQIDGDILQVKNKDSKKVGEWFISTRNDSKDENGNVVISVKRDFGENPVAQDKDIYDAVAAGYAKAEMTVVNFAKNSSKVIGAETWDDFARIQAKQMSSINIQQLEKWTKTSTIATSAISLGFTAYDINSTQSVKSSHILDAGMVAVGVVCPVCALTYYGVDLIVKSQSESGMSMGQMLDKYVNDNTQFKKGKIIDWSEKK
jgi:hypothetical protein